MGAAFAVIVPFFFLWKPFGPRLRVSCSVLDGSRQPVEAGRAVSALGRVRPLHLWRGTLSLLSAGFVVAGRLLGALLPWKMASGAYVFCALTASGCSMFLLARRYLPRKDAIFAAALYAANPYYVVVVYWRSALAELLAGCLLPLLLLMILRDHDRGRRIVVPLSLVVAAAWLTNAPSAVMVNYSLALLILIMAITFRQPKLILYGAFAVGLGAALAGFYLIPAALGRKVGEYRRSARSRLAAARQFPLHPDQ